MKEQPQAVHTDYNPKKELERIWNDTEIKSFPELKERGFLCFENPHKDILITGFNPSYREIDSDKDKLANKALSVQQILHNGEKDTYWGPIIKLVHNENIDLRNQTAYLDMFYFRETRQARLKNKILKENIGISFCAKQVAVTMNTIEKIIQPKLIIVKNKESWSYYGKRMKNGNCVWMGYLTDPIATYDCGELCRITGIVDSDQRINYDTIRETNLKGTYILFSSYSRYTKRELRPDAQFISRLLERAILNGK